MNGAVDWNDFQVLLAVVERGSISAGARALNISQPTAGRRIAALERTLGSRLLVRRNRGVLPTPAGEDVLAEARDMALRVHAALRRATGTEPLVARTVRIAITEGLGTRWLPTRLAKHSALLSGIRIELLLDPAPVDLSAREADIALRLVKPRQPNLVTRRVASLGCGLFASRSYLKAHGTPKRASDLKRHQHVGFVDRAQLVPCQWHRSLAPADRFATNATSLMAMAELARAGLGITVATAALFADDPDLVRVLPSLKSPPLEVWLTTHVDVRRDATVTRIVDLLTSLFQVEARALAG